MATQVKTMQVKSDVALAETTTKLTDTVTFDVSKLPNGITYKGLKAVLSFADPVEWNKASTYDALTVVWDEATLASYASKRPVPSGIDISNELYWLRMADGDAQVEIYRQEVAEYKGDTDKNTEAISKINTSITAIDTSIDDINSTIDDDIKPSIASILSSKTVKSIEEYNVLTGNDSVTNNVALQNALNESASKGIVLLIPAKTYNVTGGITLPNGCCLVGISRLSTISYSGDTCFISNTIVNEFTTSQNVQLNIGVVLCNFTLKGAYNFTPQDNLDYAGKGAIVGCFFDSIVSDLTLSNCVCGLNLKTPPFSNDNDYSNYNAKYGDNRLFNNITVSYCSTGIYSRQYDSDFTNIRICRCANHACDISSSVISGMHVWSVCNSCIFNSCRINAIEIESIWTGAGVYTILPYALELNFNCSVSNVWIWRWNNANATNNAASVAVRLGTTVGDITYGNTSITNDSLPKGLVYVSDGAFYTGTLNVDKNVAIGSVLVAGNFIALPIADGNNNTYAKNISKYIQVGDSIA